MQTHTLPSGAAAQLRLQFDAVPSPYEDAEGALIGLFRAFAALPDELLAALFRFSRDPASHGALLIDGWPIDAELPPTPTSGQLPAGGRSLHAEKSLLGLAAQMGTPVGYRTEKDGQLVHHVVPMPGGEFTQSNRGSKVFLNFHNDSMYDASMVFNSHNPDFLLLLCLRADHERQAQTLYVDAREALALLPEAQVAVLRQPRYRMAAPSNYTLLIHGAKGDEKVWSAPVPVIQGPAAYPEIYLAANGVQPMDDGAQQALAALQQACEAAGHDSAVRLAPGQALLINNRKGVHARTAFPARYDGQDRWLLRANIRTSLWDIRDRATQQALVFA
ncbi:MAG: TauD/TfdA family dioxygenase [Rubrivivax sp.]|nr:TauD/TfdA family dioxygenase [Rubrivivax sp.]